jgi:hypothetical protein
MPSVAEFAAFFGRYREFQEGDRDSFAAYMDRVRSELPRLQEAVRDEALQSAPHFNIFHTLGLVYKEAELHTPLLRHLLDPSADHGQGLLFLECLFDCWKDRIVPPPAPLNDGIWLVRSEFHMPGLGRLDLLIENAKKNYVLIIENKIESNDEAGQLPRYREWMDRYRHGWRGQLVYLTPDGRMPVSDTCRKCLSHGHDVRACGPVPRLPGRCRCFSYDRDIREFLAASLKGISAMRVHPIVAQYVDVLDVLMEDYDENDSSTRQDSGIPDE